MTRLVLLTLRGDGFPVVGRQRAQIDDFERDAFALERRRGHFGAMHQRAVGDDADVAAFAHHARLAERNGELRSRIFRAVVGLAVEVLVFEEHHGSSQRMAVRSRPQVSSAVEGITTRKPGNVREQALRRDWL